MTTNSVKGYGYTEKEGDNKWLSYLKKTCNEQNIKFSLTNPRLKQLYYEEHPEIAALKEKQKRKRNINILTTLINKQTKDDTSMIISKSTNKNNNSMDVDTKEILLQLINEIEEVKRMNEYLNDEVEKLNKELKKLKEDPERLKRNTEKKQTKKGTQQLIQEQIEEWVKMYEEKSQHQQEQEEQQKEQEEQKEQKETFITFIRNEINVTTNDIDRVTENPKQSMIDIIINILESNIKDHLEGQQHIVPIVSFKESGIKESGKTIYVYDCNNNEELHYKVLTNDQIIYLIKEVKSKVMRSLLDWKKNHQKQGTFTDKNDDNYIKVIHNATSLECNHEKTIDKIRQTLYRLCLFNNSSKENTE